MTPTTPIPFSELDVKLPIVMLPVRLETRYFDIDPDNVELRIRIFPSAAHVTSARPGIDPQERDAAIAYWKTRKTTGDNSAVTDASWQRLVEMFGDTRAQYLVRILTPTTDASGGVVFPTVPINPPPDTSTVLAGEAIGLPSRFFAAGYLAGSRSFLISGLKVPATIAAGPHGDANAIRWQSDFTAAEAIGLAIRVRLTRGVAQSLTQLFVFGVREGADAATSQAALESLLERHSRENGVALLPAGTPTNNTSTARVTAPAPSRGITPSKTTDHGRTASALGMNAAAFTHVSGPLATTDPIIEAMHTAMWPATVGYFLHPLMSELGGGQPQLSDAGMARARTLFQKYVRPRGPYPALALGGQPFGVLPVSSLSAWKSPQGGEDPAARVLATLRSNWIAAANANMPRLGRSGDFGADLKAVLSQSPISTRWLARTVQIAQVSPFSYEGAKFRTGLDWLLAFKMNVELAPLGLQYPYMTWFLFDDQTFQMNVPLVAPAEASRSAALPVNYIDSIATAGVQALKAHSVAGASPSSLLYLSLRHATLQVMARAAWRMSGSQIIEYVFNYNPEINGVWVRMQTPIEALGNRTLTEVFNGPLPNHPDLSELALHRTALTTLSRVPVSELERLTAETLDASSYRLDAWITALASERLASMRAAKPLGSHLGAYAWVEAPPLPAILPKDGAAPVVDPDSEGYMHAPGLDHARTAAILRAGFIARRQESAQADLAIDISSDRVRDARSLVEAIRNGASLAALLGERIERWMVEAGSGPDLSAVRAQFSLIDGSGRKRIHGLKAAQAWGSLSPVQLSPVQKRLLAVMDSIGDLLLAEAVHQQAKGNPNRAQPALAALETGVGLPGDFDVARTDSDSTPCTWRLVLPLAPAALNAWIGGIIGNPATLSATVTQSGHAPVTVTLAQIEVSAIGLLDFVKAGDEATALADKLAQKAGGGSVIYSAALKQALEAAFAISRLLRNSRKLQAGDVGPNRTPLPTFDRKSVRKQWLHDLARVRPSIEALDSLDFILRRTGKEAPLQFLATDQGLNVVFIGNPPAGALTGLLIDGWNETTPGIEVTTGISMHYDAPRSRAPQAILVVTPPNLAGWSIDAVQSVLIETSQLAQIRMVTPADVCGSFLPATYFANNFAEDTVATNFSSLGIIPQFVSP